MDNTFQGGYFENGPPWTPLENFRFAIEGGPRGDRPLSQKLRGRLMSTFARSRGVPLAAGLPVPPL